MTSKRFRPAPLALLLAAAAPAFATDGYFAHGYGIRGKGMGGASVALAQDAYGGANNPASMVFAGARLDIDADLFMPRRDAERTGAGFPTLNGRIDSDRRTFLIPELGYNRLWGRDLSLGVTVYGNGGMNTSYPQGNFNCGGGPANMLCGSGGLGVDMMQLVVAPTVAWRPAERHAVGAALLLAYQRFEAKGLQAFANAPGFPPFTGAPDSVTNRGHDSATGVGVRIGYQGRLSDMLTIGAAYSPKIDMGRFDKYRGLFAGAGDFDIPSNWSVGIALTPTPAWTVAFDLQRINYGGVASVGNASAPTAPLGAANGPGFGWRDIDIYKLGVAWRTSERLTLRAGFNHGENPIRPSDVTFNIVAPGVITDHYTLGMTWRLGGGSELSAMLMVAPRQSVSGPSLFNAMLGPGAGGNETIRMRETSVGLGWSQTF